MEEVVPEATDAASFLNAVDITNLPILLRSFHGGVARTNPEHRNGIEKRWHLWRCGVLAINKKSRNGGVSSSTFFSEVELAGKAPRRRMAAARPAEDGGYWVYAGSFDFSDYLTVITLNKQGDH